MNYTAWASSPRTKNYVAQNAYRAKAEKIYPRGSQQLQATMRKASQQIWDSQFSLSLPRFFYHTALPPSPFSLSFTRRWTQVPQHLILPISPLLTLHWGQKRQVFLAFPGDRFSQHHLLLLLSQMSYLPWGVLWGQKGGMSTGRETDLSLRKDKLRGISKLLHCSFINIYKCYITSYFTYARH